MRKYLYIYKSEIMGSLQYVANIFINFIAYFIHIFIFFYLWDYIYSNPEELINGYSKNQMIWYVIITELIWSATGGRKLCRKIVEDVKGGNIVYNMNKPYSYVGYALWSHLGEMTVKVIAYVVMACVVGLIFLGSFPNITIIQSIIVIFSGILATIIDTLITILIGLLSFLIEDANPIYWLYSKVILILGVIFPIEFFPKIFQGVLKYTPIYVVSYGPAKLFVNFNYDNALNILSVQVVYLMAVYTFNIIVYKKGVKRLNVNGG